MVTLSISLRVTVADETAAAILNTKIVNEAKKIPNISISSAIITQLTKPEDIKKT